MITSIVIGCALVALLLAVLTAIGTVVIERQYPPEGRFVDVPGGRLHVLERGKPDGPVVVLLHGASGNLQYVNAALGATIAARYRVIMIDRPGHGWSDRPGGDDDASLARQTELVAQALERLGVTRVILVGVSWFGALTETGLEQITIAAAGVGDGSRVPVSGLGDSAVYWENQNDNMRGVIALRGHYVVDFWAHNVEPPPAQGQLVALVRKALDAL